MSHKHRFGSLKAYHDPNDPQNGSLEEDGDVSDTGDEQDWDLAFEARESARERAQEWKSKQFEP
jgi:hypothetical protein